jgi:hypothetical protein
MITNTEAIVNGKYNGFEAALYYFEYYYLVMQSVKFILIT